MQNTTDNEQIQVDTNGQSNIIDSPLYLFVGPSGCGKTTITKLLEEKYKYKGICSYTTRKPRYDGEEGHVFISDVEFNALKNLVAYTVYNGFRYGTTEEQLDSVNLYVVDIPGVETLLQNYSKLERKICVFYFDSTVKNRIDRMINRHDSNEAIIKRLYNDEEFDWYRQLDKIVWKYKNVELRNVELHRINANENVNDVLKQVLYYINKDKVSDVC